MALFNCPECGKQISDKAEKCPYCGLPSSYFNVNKKDRTDEEIDYSNISNILISFDSDYNNLFSPEHYITHRELEHLKTDYEKYYITLKHKMVFQYVCNNAGKLHIDIDSLKRFLLRMNSIGDDVTTHNSNYVDETLSRESKYFDNILKDIDPNIRLDEEQRRAVITDDDHCLLVAGAGAGKTTTMAAKVKYLVEKKHINPEEIIVISYTNKAIGELRERINSRLGIPAKICTFHAFAFEIVKRFSVEPPEINFSSYQIVFDMLEKSIFNNKKLMRNLVWFLGYYFDLTEDVFKFENMNQYHIFKANQDYETLKSGLGEYVKKVEQQRSKRVKTLTGEFLRSVQEVQIANFLYLNGIDYEYERVYPQSLLSKNKYY